MSDTMSCRMSEKLALGHIISRSRPIGGPEGEGSVGGRKQLQFRSILMRFNFGNGVKHYIPQND